MFETQRILGREREFQLVSMAERANANRVAGTRAVRSARLRRANLRRAAVLIGLAFALVASSYARGTGTTGVPCSAQARLSAKGLADGDCAPRTHEPDVHQQHDRRQQRER
jgi:hypothetical protein